MASLELPKPFIERLKQTAEAEGKSVEQFLTEAIDAYVVRETAKEKGEAVPPEAALKDRSAPEA